MHPEYLHFQQVFPPDYLVILNSPHSTLVAVITLTLKHGHDLLNLLIEKSKSPTSRLSVQKAALALDRVAFEVALRDREIERLRALLDQANPPKRRKVAQNPNERFINLAQILAQANQEPEQCTCKAKSVISEAVLVDKEGSSESEDLELVRWTGCD